VNFRRRIAEGFEGVPERNHREEESDLESSSLPWPPRGPGRDSTYGLRARWVFPVAGPPIEWGWVQVAAGRIASVGAKRPDGPHIDLGETALLPGLVNCHAHLEFSDLDRPLGNPRLPFPTWIGEVVRYRRQQAEAARDWLAVRRAAWQRGLDECRSTGTVALGEIATLPWDWESFRPLAAPPHVELTVFLEWLGLSAERFPPLWEGAERHLDRTAWWEAAGGGLSPHAPYTVHPDLLATAIAWSNKRRIPLAMHLAESAEEMELLATGDGPFAELLRRLGVWQPDLFPRGRRPLDYLQSLGRAYRVLVIHGNYLEEDEMRYVAEQRDTMSVIHCPRTHAYFGHPRYPLARMLELGVPVALGTDSRASNPDLSLLEELRFVARHHAELSGERILKLGTLDGARALGCGDTWGMLAPGRPARFTLVPLGPSPVADPFEALWEGGPAQAWEGNPRSLPPGK
jgi:aminodeoxyfutalosine deaminase